MNTPITAEQFWGIFASEFRKAVEKDSNWQTKWNADKSWTPFMMDVLTEVGHRLGFQEQHAIAREYYRLDIGYFSKGALPDTGRFVDWDVWNLEVAIEHENNSESWYEEWVKLIHLNCGLKVVITYHDYCGAESIDTRLERAKQIYNQSEYRQSPDSWCLIFGPTWKSERRDFVAYSFDGKQFRPLSKCTTWPDS